MRRRDFAFLVGAATMAPRALFAQTTTRPPVVGSLWFNTNRDEVTGSGGAISSH
jgi:hypothetical protein